MVALTDSAVQAARTAVEAAAGQAAGLRIMVRPAGCAGLQFGLQLEEGPGDADAVIRFEGLDVYVDQDSVPLLDAVTVDFVERLEGAGFVFENAAPGGGCNCGKKSCH
ncbi:HesB/IscA family protein [Rhodocista pekingensis]|uniref:HesB/IscA family protein n=1 Tax=Rhodocista pekingensis TaxID=201185 RepID=A0ABW2KRG1_9PROT